MKLKLGVVLLSVSIMGSFAAPRPSAQVVRESGATSIAGSLGGGAPTSAWWTFKSSGDEILFASLDADIYATRSEHHEGETAAVEAEEGGGCEDAGPSRFCLQVLDSYGVVLCQSVRPAPPPGWQRDPRMACLIPPNRVPLTYTVRVSLATAEGGCLSDAGGLPVAEARSFLLDLSLRRIAASGVSVQQAAAQSRNQY